MMNCNLIQTAVVVAVLSSSARAQKYDSQRCDGKCQTAIRAWLISIGGQFLTFVAVTEQDKLIQSVGVLLLLAFLIPVLHCCLVCRDKRRKRPISPESLEVQDLGLPSPEEPYRPPGHPQYYPFNVSIDPNQINAQPGPTRYPPPSYPVRQVSTRQCFMLISLSIASGAATTFTYDSSS
jgi:hypothetical protein